VPVALVTGSSRGIGQAAAIELAKKGFDVAVAARTVAEGDGRDDGDFHRGRAIEGSLQATAAAVETHGVRALPVRLDLLEPDSVDTCVERVLAEFGRLDVLVNNATLHTYSNTRIRDLTRENIEDFTRATFAGPLLLIKHALPAMVAQGGGRIINVSSAAGLNDPPAAPGEGGWGVLYGMVKAAQYRMPGLIRVEYPDSNILSFSLNPGFIKTPVIRELPFFREAGNDLPPSVPGQVIAWLATADAADAEKYVCTYIDAPALARELNLVP
jgi:NAD(P)-dependent dehydrogenase (short-subunit alcohol dehydrogenase family)